MKKTISEVEIFNRYTHEWLHKNKEESKFSYALNRVLKRLRKPIEDYQDQVDEIDIKHSAVDDKGIILRDERGGLRYTKDEMLARNKDRRELTRTSLEFEPYYATEVPELTEDQRDAFVGFVVKEPEVGLEAVK